MPNTTDQFPLATYTNKLTERLRELVPAALHEGEVEAIHQARVTTRRLRAALNLLDPVLQAKTRKPIAKTLKRLRQRLGPLRDADVMLAHLDDLKKYSKHVTAIVWMEKHLLARRDDAAKQALSDVPPAKMLAKLGAWWGISQEIVGAREQVDSLLAHSLHTQLDEFTSATEPLLRNGEDEAVSVGATPVSPSVATANGAAQASQLQIPQRPTVHSTVEANPHAVRIAGKLLRYTVEMAEVEGHTLPKSVLKTFKKMQDALGTWHDFVVLTETAMELSVEQILPAVDAPMQQRVLDLAEFALRRSQAHLKQFVDLWKKNGEEISRAIRGAFPDPREIIEPKTDPDPAGSTEPSAPAVADSDRPAAF